MRSILRSRVGIAVVLAGLLLPLAALAGSSKTKESRSSPNKQLLVWRTGDQTTSDTSFESIAGLGAHNLFMVGRGGISVTISVNFRGAPMDIRVSEGEVYGPGPARFRPGDGLTSESFTFVSAGSKRPSCHYVDVEWRSPTGKPVTLEGATVTVLFHEEGLSGGAACL